MNTALRIAVILKSLLLISACGKTSQPKSLDASLSPPISSSMIETANSTIPQKFPLLSGAWKGIRADKGRMFSWMLNNGKLEGTYLVAGARSL